MNNKKIAILAVFVAFAVLLTPAAFSDSDSNAPLENTDAYSAPVLGSSSSDQIEINDLTTLVSKAAEENAQLILMTDITIENLSSSVSFANGVTLDLNGHSITIPDISEDNHNRLVVADGTVTIKDSTGIGSIVYENSDNSNLGKSPLKVGGGETADAASTLILENVNIRSEEYGVSVFANGSLIVNGGSIIAEASAISGNGITSSSTSITLNGGYYESETAAAIYLSANGTNTYNVTGGEFVGLTGFDIRAGTVEIDGAKITATGNTEAENTFPSSNGPSGWGMGIAVFDHVSYGDSISVTIKNVEFDCNTYDIYVGQHPGSGAPSGSDISFETVASVSLHDDISVVLNGQFKYTSNASSTDKSALFADKTVNGFEILDKTLIGGNAELTITGNAFVSDNIKITNNGKLSVEGTLTGKIAAGANNIGCSASNGTIAGTVTLSPGAALQYLNIDGNVVVDGNGTDTNETTVKNNNIVNTSGIAVSYTGIDAGTVDVTANHIEMAEGNTNAAMYFEGVRGTPSDDKTFTVNIEGNKVVSVSGIAVSGNDKYYLANGGSAFNITGNDFSETVAQQGGIIFIRSLNYASELTVKNNVFPSEYTNVSLSGSNGILFGNDKISYLDGLEISGVSSVSIANGSQAAVHEAWELPSGVTLILEGRSYNTNYGSQSPGLTIEKNAVFTVNGNIFINNENVTTAAIITNDGTVYHENAVIMVNDGKSLESALLLGGNIQLADSFTYTTTNAESAAFNITKDTVLDLNGKTLVSGNVTVLKVINSNLTVCDSSSEPGFITSSYSSVNSYSAVQVGAANNVSGNLVLKDGVHVEGNGYGIYCMTKSTVEIVDAAIVTGLSAVSGNGENNNSIVTIHGGSFKSTTSAAVFFPSTKSLTVTGGEFFGKTGFDIRAGTVSIQNVEITLDQNDDIDKTGPSGPSSWGMGIAIIDNGNYAPDSEINVAIKDVYVSYSLVDNENSTNPAKYYDIYVGDLNLGENGVFKAEFGKTYEAKHNVTLTINTLVSDNNPQSFIYKTTANSQAGRLALDCFGLEISENFVLTEDSTLTPSTPFGIIRDVTVEGADEKAVLEKLAEIKIAILVKSTQSQLGGEILLKIGDNNPINFLSTYGMAISSDECILGLAPNENGGISFGLIRGEITVGKSSVGVSPESYNIFLNGSHNDSMEILPDAKLIIGKDYTGTVHTSGTLLIYEGGILEVADGKTFSTITGSGSDLKYGNVILNEGAQIVLGNNSSINGAIYSHDGSSVSDITAGENGLTITGGLLIIDGTATKITINEGVDEEGKTVTSNVIIKNFDDNNTTVTYKDKDGNEVTEPERIAEIANVSYEGPNVIDGVTIESNDITYNGLQDADVTVTTPSSSSSSNYTRITSISYNGVMLTTSGENLTSNNAAGATATWNSTLGGFTDVKVKNAGIYTLHYEILPTTSNKELSINVSFEVTKKEITLSNTENITKVYDGNTSCDAEIKLNDILGSDDVTITAEYGSKNVYDHIPLKFKLTGADAGNYTLVETEVTGKITAKELNIDASENITKVYDGTDAVDLTGKIELTGVIPNDDVSFTYASAVFDNKTAGESKTITITGAELTGRDAHNYKLAETLKDIKGSITPLELTIENTTQSISKEFDGDADYSSDDLISTYYSTNVIENDDVTITFKDVKFNSKDVNATEISFTVTLSGDNASNYTASTDGYTLDAKITPKDISTAVIKITSDKLTYNGKSQTVEFNVTDGDPTIITENDWSIQNNSNKGTDAGEYTLTIAGKNNYAGTATTAWEIAKYFITDKDIIVEDTFYKDEGVTPTVTISANGDTFTTEEFTVAYFDTLYLGGATAPLGLGSYKAIITSLTGEKLAKNYSVDINSFKEFEVSSDILVKFYSQDGIVLYQWTVKQYEDMYDHPEEYRTYLPLSEGKIFKGWATELNGDVVYSSNQPITLDSSEGLVELYAVFEDIEGNEPSVSIDLPTNFVVGEEAVFSVSTTAGDYAETMVKGVAELLGSISADDYTIWYLENNPDNQNYGQWLELTGDSFGPTGGFPLADATSYFKIVFNKACVFNLKVSIVAVPQSSDVAETNVIAETGATVIVLDKSVSAGPTIDTVYYDPVGNALCGGLISLDGYDSSDLFILFEGPDYIICNYGGIEIDEYRGFEITTEDIEGGYEFLPGMYVIKLCMGNADDYVLLDRYYFYLEEQEINIDFTGFEKNGNDANDIINNLLDSEETTISDSVANTAYVIYTQSRLLSDNLVGCVYDSSNNLVYTENLDNDPGRHVWYFTLTGDNSETGILYNSDCAPGTYKVVIKSNENTVASDYFYVPDNRAAYILDVSHLPSENKVGMTLALNGYTKEDLGNFAIALSGPADIRDSSPLSYYVDSENENASYREENGSIIITMKMDAELFVSGGYVFTLLMLYNNEYVVPADRYYLNLDLQLPKVEVIASGYDENAATVKTNLVNALNISPDELSIADKTMYIVYDQFGYNYANMIGKLFIEGNDGEFTQIGSWYGDNFEVLKSDNGKRAWYFSFDENQPGDLSKHYAPGATYLLQIVASYENGTEPEVVCYYEITIPAAEENYSVDYEFNSELGTVSGSQLIGNIVAFTVEPNEGYAAKVTSNNAIIFSDGSSYIAILNNKSAKITVEFEEIGTANRVTVEAEKCTAGGNTGLMAYLEAYNGLNLPEGKLTAHFSVMTSEKINGADFGVLSSMAVSEDITSSSDTESGCPLIYTGTAKLLSGYASYEFERTDCIIVAPQSSIIQF